MTRTTRNSKRGREPETTTLPQPTVKRNCVKRILGTLIKVFRVLIIVSRIARTKRKVTDSTMIDLTPKRPRSVPVDSLFDISAIHASPPSLMDEDSYEDYSPIKLEAGDSAFDSAAADITPESVTDKSSPPLKKAGFTHSFRRKLAQFRPSCITALSQLPTFAPKNAYGYASYRSIYI